MKNTEQHEAIEESVEAFCETASANISSAADSLEQAESCETPSDLLQNLKDTAAELRAAQKEIARAIKLQEQLIQLFRRS